MKFPSFRMWVTLAVAILLAILVTVFAPQQLPVTLYKLSLISGAGVAGYWLDREMFPYARPDSYLNVTDWRDAHKRCDAADLTIAEGYHEVFAAAMLRRALVVAAAMMGVGLGA